MLNLANKITLLRILMAPLVVILLYFEGPVTCILAALAFIFASITDWADGYIARAPIRSPVWASFWIRWQTMVLICSILIMFVKLAWAPGLGGHRYCLPRELVVTGLRAIAIDEGIVLAADYLGKVKTVLQILAVVPLTLHYPLWGYDLHMVGLVLLYAAMLLAVGSGFNYCYNFYRRPVPGRPMKHVYEHFAAAS